MALLGLVVSAGYWHAPYGWAGAELIPQGFHSSLGSPVQACRVAALALRGISERTLGRPEPTPACGERAHLLFLLAARRAAVITSVSGEG